MSKWKKVLFSDFLTERKNRFKPKDATALGLKRVDKINFSAEIFISDKPTNTDMILVKKGDLLISGINAEKGAIAVYEGDEDVLASIHYSSYQFDKKKINIHYLKWFLISDAFRNLLKEQSGGGIKTELKAKHILPLQIDLPDLETQKEIVKTISLRDKNYSEFFSELTNQQTLIAQLRQSILQEAVQGKLVKQNKNDEPASELLKRIKTEKEKLIKHGKLKQEQPLPIITQNEIPYSLPEAWAWSRFGEASINRDGDRVPLSTEVRKKRQGVYDYYGAQGVIDKIDDYVFEKTLLLIAEDGGNLLRRNKPVAFKAKGKYWVNNHAHVVDAIDYSSLDYFEIFINSINLEPYLNGQPPMQIKLNRGKLNIILIPLPPLPEQKRIVEKVNQLMQRCNELEQQMDQSVAHAKELMQSVLREVFEKKNEYKIDQRMSVAAEK